MSLPHQSNYRADLDGLRAVAILGVLFFHFDFGVPGGFAGVDLFFVLSGFLITSTLYATWSKTGTLDLPQFWARRIRRILPAYWFIGLCVFFYATITLGPLAHQKLFDEALHQLFFISNFEYAGKVSYGADWDAAYFFLHTWSLCIEEQFYIFLPVLLWVGFKATKRLAGDRFEERQRVVAGVLLGLAALASFVLCVLRMAEEGVSGMMSMSHSYFLPQYRVWELLLGALMAWSFRGNLFPRWTTKTRAENFLSLIGLLTVIGSFFLLSTGSVFPGVGALSIVMGTLLLVGTPNAWLNRKALQFAPLVYTGRISYSLYLWHWPVLVALENYYSYNVPPGRLVLGAVLSAVLASLTYHFVELPFRRRDTTKPRIWIGGAAAGLAFWLCIWFTCSQLTPVYDLKKNPDMVPKARDIQWGKPVNHDPDFGGVSRLGLHPDHKPDQSKVLPSFVVLGDSHAYALAHAVDAYLEQRHEEESVEQEKYGFQLAYCGLKMAPGFELPPNGCTKDGRGAGATQFIQSVLKVSPVDTIFVAHRYHSIYHREGTNWKESDRIAFEIFFEQWVKRMSEGGRRVYLMQQIPECDYPFFAERFFAWHVTLWGRLPQYVENYAEQMEALKPSREFLSGLASRYANVMILDPLPYVYDEQGRIKLHNGERALYLDRDHLTTEGALAYLLPMLEDAVPFPPIEKAESEGETSTASGPE